MRKNPADSTPQSSRLKWCSAPIGMGGEELLDQAVTATYTLTAFG